MKEGGREGGSWSWCKACFTACLPACLFGGPFSDALAPACHVCVHSTYFPLGSPTRVLGPWIPSQFNSCTTLGSWVPSQSLWAPSHVALGLLAPLQFCMLHTLLSSHLLQDLWRLRKEGGRRRGMRGREGRDGDVEVEKQAGYGSTISARVATASHLASRERSPSMRGAVHPWAVALLESSRRGCLARGTG